MSTGKPIIVSDQERTKIITLYVQHGVMIKDIASRLHHLSSETISKVLIEAGVHIKYGPKA